MKIPNFFDFLKKIPKFKYLFFWIGIVIVGSINPYLIVGLLFLSLFIGFFAFLIGVAFTPGPDGEFYGRRGGRYNLRKSKNGKYYRQYY